jgi:ERCC4-related helicase
MLPIEKLSNYSATQWRFLSNPQKYVSASDVRASQNTERRLALESTERQFVTAEDILARLGGCFGQDVRKGVLLADDVGLGKTTVAALVAWVFSSAGEKRSVRILVPNDVMVRRWEAELKSHVELLKKCAPNLLDIDAKRIKSATNNLTAGAIQVVKHSFAGNGKTLQCDLLIVDEAHRAKGEGTAFSDALKLQSKKAKRVLILTATPFSIQIAELNRMLTLVGAGHAHAAVKSFSLALDKIYSTPPSRQADATAKDLIHKATKAIDAVQKQVVRHSIDDLPDEKASLGMCEEWKLADTHASADELELLLRMDRLLRIGKSAGMDTTGATNDARFHVGWQHFDETLSGLIEPIKALGEPNKSLMESHLRQIKKLRKRVDEVGPHSKMLAVAEAVIATVNQGEKMVIFCHHIATAQELTLCLAGEIPPLTPTTKLDDTVWGNAWQQVFEDLDAAQHNPKLRDTFIRWLCSDMICAQTQSWFNTIPRSGNALVKALTEQHARHHPKETIADAARSLFEELLKSKSGKGVLREAENCPELMPGAMGKKSTGRVLGVCEPKTNAALFIRNNQPDTVIQVFGSPFGPDVLVVTDKLSEGIDLHNYCRHLIHYELDASPIRTVQRNGRIRRVQSWAAVTGEKIRYAYPSFGGTRDQRLVDIMKKRVATFSLLLGGVSDFADLDMDLTSTVDEEWRSAVVQQAQRQLKKEGGKLVARRPGQAGLD